ncbi:hypothetical protein CAPTEDRAFT_195351 [Capitella teleta]|uniref:Uncharacterized protein n=1 Tax=Capitella teleta TaxID=283909 RepID=R7TDE3_CAPTE|nr:hypothetical protein CAPTEDRAFT_195351 [Capitella teleta]|eukprot:ELT91522.1 hypothetical protein CAPTEDRAFT_195351 [Capitella teleta]
MRTSPSNVVKLTILNIAITIVFWIIPLLTLKCNSSVKDERRWNTSTQVHGDIKAFRIWTMDMHMATIKDLVHRLTPLGVEFTWKSMSLHCKAPNDCGESLKIVNKNNALHLNDSLIADFYEAYKDDAEIHSVDAFVCFHPAAMCQLFIPFNKSIIIVASTRYEIGRDESVTRWMKWNDDIRELAKDPKNIIAANNLYDAHYLEYFTGVSAKVLPSYCGYISASYSPSNSTFLLYAGRGMKSTFSVIFMKNYTELCKYRVDCPEILYVKDTYPAGYSYEELSGHQGLVYAPYQVSTMSLFEQYRMNLPMFFPSLTLLSKWDAERTWVKERIIFTTKTFLRPNGSEISCDPSQVGIPDPNTVEDAFSIRYWLQKADFYQWPYITYYESYEDLVQQMLSVDLQEISSRMKAYNLKHRERLDAQWLAIIKDIALKAQKSS